MVKCQSTRINLPLASFQFDDVNPSEIHRYLSGQHRNIYTEAQLFAQNRREVKSYLDILAHPEIKDEVLEIKGDNLASRNGDSFTIKDNVADFRFKRTDDSEQKEKWADLNKILLNYQQYLTPYVLLNSLPMYNYIGERTGLNKLQNANVVDVGAGTGQIYGTFFFHQESINYFLVDPNLRLIHDQFFRLYPKLVHYPMAHILAYAENLPFKSASVDLVLSISSIDHFVDYKQFMKDAHRILKSGGQILISSHIDAVNNGKRSTPKELVKGNTVRSVGQKVFNRIAVKSEYYARKYHNKKRGIVTDDHMHHFETTAPIETALTEAGFRVELAEVFSRHFFVKAQKI